MVLQATVTAGYGQQSYVSVTFGGMGMLGTIVWPADFPGFFRVVHECGPCSERTAVRFRPGQAKHVRV